MKIKRNVGETMKNAWIPNTHKIECGKVTSKIHPSATKEQHPAKWSYIFCHPSRRTNISNEKRAPNVRSTRATSNKRQKETNPLEASLCWMASECDGKNTAIGYTFVVFPGVSRVSLNWEEDGECLDWLCRGIRAQRIQKRQLQRWLSSHR